MTLPPLSIHRCRVETAMAANAWFAVAAFTALFASSSNGNALRIVVAIVVSGSMLSTFLLWRKRSLASIASTLGPIQLVLLVAPWFIGGIRQPLSYLEIPVLLLSGFLAGPRLARWLAVVFSLDIAVLAWCEIQGIVASLPVSEFAHLAMLAEASVFCLYFVARPLALTQRLLERSRADNLKRTEHQQRLVEMKRLLGSRIAEREKELLGLQSRLRRVTEGLSSSYAPIVQRIAVRSRFLQDNLKDRDETIQFPIQRILAGCDRLTTIHEALSRFARLGPQGLHLRELDAESVRSMVRTVWEEIRVRYPRAGHRLFLNEFHGCTADPDLLRQVWQHLISNAAKFSAREPKPRIVVGWKDGEYYVNDNGVGFDAKSAPNLYELFNRNHPKGEFPGDGIGLASAKRIAQLHQGDLRIESEPGKGATVYLRSD